MKIILSIIAMAAAASAAPAMAGDGQRTQHVSYADLDLGSAAGRAELDRRLRIAVKSACGEASTVHLEGKNEVRRCRIAARQAAERQWKVAIAAHERKSARQYASER